MLKAVATLALLLGASILAPAPVAQAATLVVGPSGFPDLASALAAAKAGDEIVVSPGAYAGGESVDLAGLTVRAAQPSAPPVLAAPAGGFALRVAAPGVTLQGLRLAGGSPGLLADHADGLRILDVTSEGAATNGVEARFSANLTVENLVATGAGVNGLRLASSPHAAISSSRFAGDRRGVHVYASPDLAATGLNASGNAEDGIVVESSPGARLSGIDATGGVVGVWAFASPGALLDRIHVWNVSGDALVLEGASGDVASNLTLTGAGVNALRVRNATGPSVSDATLAGSLRGLHVETSSSVAVARARVSSSSEHGAVLEGVDGATLQNVTVEGARRAFWVIGSSGVRLVDVAARNATEDLLNATGSPGIVAQRSAFVTSAGNGVRLLDSPGFTLSDGAILDTRCDVFFEGSSAGASAARSTLMSTNRPAALSTDLPAGSLVACDKAAQQLARAQSLSGASCDATRWHFVVTGIADGSAPGSVEVVWNDGSSALATLAGTPGSTAHYETTQHLFGAVDRASALLPASWSGNFNLSSAPSGCGGARA